MGEVVRACSLGDCVEVEGYPNGVELYSTLDPDTRVWLDSGEWSGFLEAVKRGDFDNV